MAATLEQQLDRAQKRQKLEQAKTAAEHARLQRDVLRARARRLATYDGAKKDRRDRDWKGVSKSADAAIIPDLPTINGRARAAVNDTAYGKSITRSEERNIVGRGITPSSSARFGNGNLRLAFNEQANALFMEWANNPKMCDVEGVKTLWDFQRMAVTERKTVGGFMVMIHETGENGPDQVPLRLQAIEVEQLDMTLTRERSTNNQVRGGIEVDGFNRPVAYHIYEHTPEDYLPFSLTGSRKSRRIPAERIIHWYKQSRAGQTRGVTEFHAVLRKLRNLDEFEELEIWNARMESCAAMGIERPAPADGGESIGAGLIPGGTDDEQDSDGNREVVWEPGMVFEGLPGEEIKFYKPNRPGGNFVPFVEAVAQAIGAGVGTSFEQVTRNFHRGNFSSQRQTLLEDRREWLPVIEDMILKILKPVRDIFVRLAVLNGLIDAPGADRFFQNRRLLCACDWQGDGWEWVDPAKQAAAAKIMLDMRLDTRDRILNERGRDLRDTARQIADEREMFGDLGITLPEDKEPSARNPVNPNEPKTRVNPKRPEREGATQQSAGGDAIDWLMDGLYMHALDGDTQLVEAMN
jgi:lambda family phage portal protein